MSQLALSNLKNPPTLPQCLHQPLYTTSAVPHRAYYSFKYSPNLLPTSFVVSIKVSCLKRSAYYSNYLTLHRSFHQPSSTTSVHYFTAVTSLFYIYTHTLQPSVTMFSLVRSSVIFPPHRFLRHIRKFLPTTTDAINLAIPSSNEMPQCVNWLTK